MFWVSKAPRDNLCCNRGCINKNELNLIGGEIYQVSTRCQCFYKFCQFELFFLKILFKVFFTVNNKHVHDIYKLIFNKVPLGWSSQAVCQW